MKAHSIALLPRRIAWAGLFATLLFCLSQLAISETRTWTSADGERTFDGELVAYEPDGGTVTVIRADGRSMTFMTTVLSSADIEYLNSVGPRAAPQTGSSGGAVVAAGAGGTGDEPADMSKPVQVFILLGQSNMLGFGKVPGGEGSLEHAVKEEKLYPFLVDEAGEWRERKDVRNVRVMSGGQVFNNEFMNIKAYYNIRGNAIGPEIGIGHHLGNLYDAPVMILKSCIGNRSLGWDLLPPGSESFDHGEHTYAGYKESPMKRPKGTGSEGGGGWYAGKQYDDDIADAKAVLDNLDSYYPDAKKYEVAGFFWWQGDKDMRDAGLASRYEHNLVHLIKTLREEFGAPNAKFVCATLGQTQKGAGGGPGELLKAKMNVDGGSGKYPQFKGNVATVYSHPLSQGGSSSGHYNGNAKTYMDVGLAMGEAMVELLTGKR